MVCLTEFVSSICCTSHLFEPLTWGSPHHSIGYRQNLEDLNKENLSLSFWLLLSCSLPHLDVFSAQVDWPHYWDIESTTASSSFLSSSSSSFSMVSLYVCTAEWEMSQEGHTALRPFSYTQHCYFLCLLLEISNNISPRQILGQSWGTVCMLGGNIIKSTHFPNANIFNSHSCEAAGRLRHACRKTAKIEVFWAIRSSDVNICLSAVLYGHMQSVTEEIDQDWGLF